MGHDLRAGPVYGLGVPQGTGIQSHTADFNKRLLESRSVPTAQAVKASQ